MLRNMFRSTIGKKVVMAVTGLILLGFLVLHLYGNLKIFFGLQDFNHYAHWLRTLGEPVLHYAWFLWILRVVLLLAVVGHGVSAYQLSRRDIKARPSKYVHKKSRTTYATRTMRWGGVILGLYIVWHILDLTTGTVHAGGFEEGHPYENLVETFSVWWNNVIYITAMLALGFHVRHGLWSAVQTLGIGSRTRDRVLKTFANVFALLLTAGFITLPVSVMTGVVS
ncbi:succinate dehydrogenase [Streptomyces sp. NE06-03E]|uniref:succinate dehydrogenase n=1 Tax=unclassified Streptomyces TaxID=2593676 RepID=UPI00299F9998|nr:MULTISPECIES: succinate dehydrogenase [unclassified Streptomyces]MDX3054287.1 succinate dehydrogenase [Streptomyces sp. NE06-03E]